LKSQAQYPFGFFKKKGRRKGRGFMDDTRDITVSAIAFCGGTFTTNVSSNDVRATRRNVSALYFTSALGAIVMYFSKEAIYGNKQLCPMMTPEDNNKIAAAVRVLYYSLYYGVYCSA
jgi:hypothetical protein